MGQSSIIEGSYGRNLAKNLKQKNHTGFLAWLRAHSSWAFCTIQDHPPRPIPKWAALLESIHSQDNTSQTYLQANVVWATPKLRPLLSDDCRLCPLNSCGQSGHWQGRTRPQAPSLYPGPIIFTHSLQRLKFCSSLEFLTSSLSFLQIQPWSLSIVFLPWGICIQLLNHSICLQPPSEYQGK